ncbi:glycoside hydrolase [Dokdonia pacifica]|uniref:Glycosyltransferase involved in cell wall bisynthesis n=1 Tax=Dokdonia pacifica TaxID=1627892 RepID=A0A239BRK7_9FLAO|nr:glycosyltransferase family 4 protein [Dokdonia pacifica]GGG27886.1 glycoside hydrolase [Dokdonia pacifica]SNS10506.1 Glycosyltransferase involved in cell wall bisynthesis [Dokdonia pacifica]
MHIAFLTPEYPHPRIQRAAGIGTSIKNLAIALSRKQIQVTVFVYSQSEDVVVEDQGVTLHLIKHKTYRIGGWFLYRKHINRYINTVVKKQHIDVIEAPDWTGITSFMKFKIPVVIRLHGSDTYFCELEGRTQKKKNFYFEKNALIKADHILSVSAFTAKKTASLFGIKNTITTIHNGVDVSMFTPDHSKMIPKTILYFGTIIRKKGVLALAEAFNKVIAEEPSARLTFIGKDVTDAKTGTSTIQLLQSILTKEALAQVTFIAQIPYHEVANAIRSAHVVCLPSYAEAFPMTWLEAMALEKAMVTSDIGWAKELMIDGKTGYITHPDDTHKLANAIVMLLQDIDLSKTLGVQARKQILAHFTQDQIAEKNNVFYKNLIAK